MSIGRQLFESQDRSRGIPDPALCAVDFTAEVNGNYFDLDGYREFVADLYAAFPDLSHTVERSDSREGAERLGYRMTGHHTGAPFLGVQPANRPIDTTGDAIFILSGDRIEALVISFDQVGLLKQLGVE